MATVKKQVRMDNFKKNVQGLTNQQLLDALIDNHVENASDYGPSNDNEWEGKILTIELGLRLKDWLDFDQPSCVLANSLGINRSEK